MKSTFLINFSSLFIITILILVEVRELFAFQWNFTTFIIVIFAFIFVMMILMTFINMLYSFILKHFTSYSLDYDENQNRVLNTILLVNQILFLCLYLVLLFDNSMIYDLQKYRYITPFIFSILFSVLMKLNKNDILMFNFGIVLANGLLLLSQQLFNIGYKYFL